jgi:threonine synthase
MEFVSTRNRRETATAAEAVLRGLAPDGGLYCPAALTPLAEDLSALLALPFEALAGKLLHALLPSFSLEETMALSRKAYSGRFETAEVTPTAEVGEDTVLELFWGPTGAFKDVALSLLPHLLTAAKVACGQKEDILILTATSGDTGKAALAGFQDVPGTGILVFYPHGGVSPIQRLQMVTQPGQNVRVCAVRGNFDDAQSGVKKAFASLSGSAALRERNLALSSANSINLGRLAPQTVYYFKAYADMLHRGRIAPGEQVDFVVPTGNFGDILAGYFARLLGLPVGRLVCASNQNNVLTEFLRTGIYDRNRPFYRTSSPSMDILISSNLERLIYRACGDDAERCAAFMESLGRTGKYDITDDMRAKLTGFYGGFASEEENFAGIRELYEKTGYVIDTHTGIGNAV